MDGEDTSASRPMLLEQVRERMRVLHYSYRTEAQYVQWIKRFILFHDKRHPSRLGAPEVESFLPHVAVKGRVAAPTQNRAKAAILYLHKKVLGQELEWLDGVTHAKAPDRSRGRARRAAVAAAVTSLPRAARSAASRSPARSPGCCGR